MFECIESGIEKYKKHGHMYVTRVNKDHVINAHGRRFVYFCKTTDLFIGNGRLEEINTSKVVVRSILITEQAQ